MIRDIFNSISAYGNAFRIIRQYKLQKWLIIPGIISLSFGVLIFYLTVQYADNIGEFIVSWWKWEWGQNIVRKISHWIAGLAILLGLFSVYKYINLVLMAPFMSPVSEKIESGMTGVEEFDFNLTKMFRDIIRGLRINLRNLFRELLYTLGLFILSLIPGIAVFTTPLLFCVQAYYAGFGNMDYTLERHFGVKGSIHFVSRNKGIALGNGAVFLFLFMIPIAGMFLAPMLGTVAATTETVKALEREN